MNNDYCKQPRPNVSASDNPSDFDRMKFLWEEYRYRHELCWKLIFQITIAVIIILIIPYTKTAIAKSIGNWIAILPVVSIILLWFSFQRLDRELDILHRIRKKYRDMQNLIYEMGHPEDDDAFSFQVRLYLLGLGVISVFDIYAILIVWIPTLRETTNL